MSLVADYSSTSEDESSGGEEEAKMTIKGTDKPKTALPSANMLFTGGRAGEVFNNPYKEAEDAKLASLEQHVKMVNTKETMLKGDKKICWNYRKGRCRFGSNCSFVHDSDLLVAPNNSIPTETNQTKNVPSISVISRSQHGLQISGTASAGVGNCTKATNKSQGKSDGKRPHPGLGDSIVPSKKVIKQYNSTKTKNLP